MQKRPLGDLLRCRWVAFANRFCLKPRFDSFYTVPGASIDPNTEISGAPVIPMEVITCATLGFPSKKLWNCSAVSHSSMTTSSPSPETNRW